MISLKEMGHQQPPTRVVTYSATSDGFVNDNIQQQKSIAIDMRFYLLRDMVRQGHYLVFWEREKDNLSKYFTKYHPTKHHRSTRGTYIVPTDNSSKHACYQVPSDLQECVQSLPLPPPGKRATDKQGILLQQTYKVQTETYRALDSDI